MQNTIIWFLVSFTIALVSVPVTLKVLRRLKAGQNILHYVDFHAGKKGTPTMGGIIFIIPMLVALPFLVRRDSWLTNVAIIASFGFALLGFADDFLKIKRKDNQGLRAYQKIIFQTILSLFVAIVYYMYNPEGRILLPFVNNFIAIGWWIIPLTIVAIIATTNAVNLTDGVDGLASTVSLFYLAFIAAIMFLVNQIFPISEINNLAIIAAVTAGGLLTFLMFNTNKAKVFMGDTGSLYLGSIIAVVSIFSFLGFYIVFLGIMFVVSAASDIIQVLYFKLTNGKRVFLMAPYHHHLEKKGMSEAKIVFIYTVITIIVGALCIISLI